MSPLGFTQLDGQPLGSKDPDNRVPLKGLYGEI